MITCTIEWSQRCYILSSYDLCALIHHSVSFCHLLFSLLNIQHSFSFYLWCYLNQLCLHGEQKWRIWWTQKGVLNVKKCFFVKLQNMATQVTCGSITSFVILRLGGLDHQFDNLTKHKKWYRNKLLPDDQRPSSWEWWLRCWWSWCLHRSWPSTYPAPWGQG